MPTLATTETTVATSRPMIDLLHYFQIRAMFALSLALSWQHANISVIIVVAVVIVVFSVLLFSFVLLLLSLLLLLLLLLYHSQVDKRQSINFSIHKHIVLPALLFINKSGQGITKSNIFTVIVVGGRGGQAQETSNDFCCATHCQRWPLSARLSASKTTIAPLIVVSWPPQIGDNL